MDCYGRFWYTMVMARPLRFQDAGLWYHVTNRGNNRGNVFVDIEGCQHFLSGLGTCASLFGVECMPA